MMLAIILCAGSIGVLLAALAIGHGDRHPHRSINSVPPSAMRRLTQRLDAERVTNPDRQS